MDRRKSGSLYKNTIFSPRLVTVTTVLCSSATSPVMWVDLKFSTEKKVVRSKRYMCGDWLIYFICTKHQIISSNDCRMFDWRTWDFLRPMYSKGAGRNYLLLNFWLVCVMIFGEKLKC